MYVTREDSNAYITFVLYAVYGKMAEADEMMRRFADGIRRVARVFEQRMPVPLTALYRGMLVDPTIPLTTDQRYTFVSWSEDVDVACWFGSTESIISAPLAAHDSRLRGVVLQLARPERVLFHHSWAKGWEQFALQHPHMGSEGARQINWSLRTQRETITETLDELPPPIPVECVRRLSVSELDARFAPPWAVA